MTDRVYIAGPITGIEGYAERFTRAEVILRDAGYEPVSPVIKGDDESQAYRFYINHGMRLLMDCDAICMLPGWTGSRGAKLEHTYALTVNLPILVIDSQYRSVWGSLP